MAPRKTPAGDDLESLREKALATAAESTLKGLIQDITLEPASDDDGADFLRVLISLKALDRTKQSDLLALLEAVEDALLNLDDRYPSVRFSEAA